MPRAHLRHADNKKVMKGPVVQRMYCTQAGGIVCMRFEGWYVGLRTGLTANILASDAPQYADTVCSYLSFYLYACMYR